MTNDPFIQSQLEAFDKASNIPLEITCHKCGGWNDDDSMEEGTAVVDTTPLQPLLSSSLNAAIAHGVRMAMEKVNIERMNEDNKKDAATCPVYVREVREAHNYGLKVGFDAVKRCLSTLLSTLEKPNEGKV